MMNIKRKGLYRMPQVNTNEKEIFETIEARRRKLVLDLSVVSFVDFGAVSPNAKLSQEEMYSGRMISKTVSELAGQGLKGEWAEKLYILVRDNKPKNVLELGSCCGFSAIYMAKGCAEASIYTIEGAEEVAAIAKSNYAALCVQNIFQIVGRFQDVLKDTLQKIQTVDLAFIDGHHDKNATIEYYRTILPYLSKTAIVIFDDVNWSCGMQEAWAFIAAENSSIKTENLGKLGILYLGINI